jgi:hypothetical protein
MLRMIVGGRTLFDRKCSGIAAIVQNRHGSTMLTTGLGERQYAAILCVCKIPGSIYEYKITKGDLHEVTKILNKLKKL